MVPGIQVAGVEETVGCVENPDGEKHSGGRGGWQGCVGCSRDEDRPEGGYGGRVQREQVPQGERTGGAGRGRDLGGGRHYFDFRGFRGCSALGILTLRITNLACDYD